MPAAPQLPQGVHVFERGWLSCNSVLLQGAEQNVLIDSGYHTHAPLLLELVHQRLQGRPLDLLLNTHLHSDHCGGNAALAGRYPALQTWIAPGQAQAVAQWDERGLHFESTGQHCPRFAADRLLQPGERLELGGQTWDVHAAPGHDPHSVVLFAPSSGVLVSADALWENGFGVVFPELEGEHAFDAVGATLDLIGRLQPRLVIPGHGSPFVDAPGALARAHARLAHFRHQPLSHVRSGLKVLVKFKLLELQTWPLTALYAWAQQTRYIGELQRRHFPDVTLPELLDRVVKDLEAVDALRCESGVLFDVG
jgi:glyoxylase-like metal-dependent hydrolase (beta-lactamase superfamily II)